MQTETASHSLDSDSPSTRAGHLLVLAGAEGEMCAHPLRVGQALTLGRGEQADVRIDDPRLSRRHARFEATDDALHVVDLGSRNGTWLGGERVTRALVQPGDVVALAGAQVYVRALTGGAASELLPLRSRRARPRIELAPPAPLFVSPASLELRRLVERLAPRAITVLIVGETGTGKELIANELHAQSERRARPFRVVNCAAIPQTLIESVLFGHAKGAFTGAERDRAGVFQEAEGGTIFLDEVGELSREAQAALLRVLEARRVCPVGSARELSVDVRVIAATHRDLAGMVSKGEFRLDLFHRLNGVVLEVPALRERKEEIAPLARYFLSLARETERALTFEPEVLAQLCAYDWPGNVRELRNVIERAVALRDGDVIRASDLPRSVRAPVHEMDASRERDVFDLRQRVQHHEATLIREALRQSLGNQRRAAALLKLPLRTFERKLKNLRLDS